MLVVVLNNAEGWLPSGGKYREYGIDPAADCSPYATPRSHSTAGLPRSRFLSF